MARYRNWLMVVTICLPIALTGCSDDAAADKPVAAAVGKRGARTAASDSDTTWMSEAKDAVNVVNDFWQKNWNAYFTGAYAPPRVAGTYTPGSPGAPACGGEPAPPNNAFYCPAGDFLAWDGKLMRDGYAQGDSWVYLVIAHEWGHAIQNRVLGLKAVAQELQADCLAGATLFGSDKLRFEPGDTEELSTALTGLADATPWTSSKDHGNAEQRISAFNRGGQGGVKACLPV